MPWRTQRWLRYPVTTAGRMLFGDSAGNRAASLMATVTAGASFMPGLLARHRRDQVALTGLASGLQHGLVVNACARHRVLARLICTWMGREDDRDTLRAVEAAVAAGVAVVGTGLYRGLPRGADARLGAKLLTTGGARMARIGTATLVVTTADALDERYGDRYPILDVVAPASGFLVGAGLAAYLVRDFRRHDPVIATRHDETVDPLTHEALGDGVPPEPHVTAVPTSAAMGLGVAVALSVLGGVEGVVSDAIAGGIRRVVPGSDPYASLVGHSVTLGGIVAALAGATTYLYHRMEAGGSAIDAAYTTAPTSSFVSGGPESGIDWQTLGREGVRFVAMSLPVDQIADVTHTPVKQVKAPIRCFAGLDTSRTIGGRVNLVMEDLERLGAFERSVICLASPTGTGYVNYVAVETLEYLTRGDCATLALQYSLRPSYLSLDRVMMAREQNLALLSALSWRIRAIPKEKRPRLVGFGESLGAQTLQSCFLHEGSAGMRRVGMDCALFLGTPAGSHWGKDWRRDRETTDPKAWVTEVSGYAQWLQELPGLERRPRYVLVSNPDDPITKFTPLLALARPEWLPRGGPNPPGVPETAVWLPYVSMLVTLVDIANAIDFVPGVFVARGHDYRASIARMVSEAYRLPVDDDEMNRIEYALRAREKRWAERRMLAEQVAKAGQAVSRGLRRVSEISSPPAAA